MRVDQGLAKKVQHLEHLHTTPLRSDAPTTPHTVRHTNSQICPRAEEITFGKGVLGCYCTVTGEVCCSPDYYEPCITYQTLGGTAGAPTFSYSPEGRSARKQGGVGRRACTSTCRPAPLPR